MTIRTPQPARDRARETRFLTDAERGVDGRALPLSFVEHCQQRLEQGERDFGNRWSTIGIHRFARELSEEAADLAAWAALADQALDLDASIPEDVKTSIRLELRGIANRGARAHRQAGLITSLIHQHAQETTMATTSLPATPFKLATGAHGDSFNGEACFNELGSILAGEPFTARPRAFSPIIRTIGMRLNDRLDDDRRQLLLPYVWRALGTGNDGQEEHRRQMCNEWLLHRTLPDWLDKAGRPEAAAKLRGLPANLIATAVRIAIGEARDEAWAARREATDRLAAKIEYELTKNAAAAAVAAATTDVAAAVAAADADAATAATVAAAAAAADVAVAVADAAADAAVAVAAAAAATDAAAAAAAVAVAAAAAAAAATVAVAAAAADVAAAAVAVADAAASLSAFGPERRRRLRQAVDEAVKPQILELVKPQADLMLVSVLELLDQMLPAKPLISPAVEHADVICGIHAA